MPLGALARLMKAVCIWMRQFFSADGREFIRRADRGPGNDAVGAGKRLGQILIQAGADKILRLAGRSVSQPHEDRQ